ncbi:MAG: protein RarD [Gammaproteobacteria bacterium]|nr:MAG: protein RarD [Gammaproteobacteria bacterium]
MKLSSGLVQAVTAYAIWGLFPLYWVWLKQVPAVEVMAHRIVWSFVTLLVFMLARKRLITVVDGLKNKKMLLLLTATALLISINWLLYIWAVSNGHVLESSLGYYINPLVSVVLGMLFLGERLRRFQYLAVLFAFVGVLFLALMHGQIPWVALGLAFSFAFYALLRKWVELAAQSAMLIETGLLLMPALCYLVLVGQNNAIISGGGFMRLLLICGGAVTLLPLILLTGALKTLPLSTIGFLQYLSPTMQFLIGLLVFNEPFDIYRGISFLLIWTGLVIYSLEALWVANKKPAVGRVK